MYSQDEHTVSDVMIPLFVFLPIIIFVIVRFGWEMEFRWFFMIFILVPIACMLFVRALLEKGVLAGKPSRSALRKALAVASYMAIVGVLLGFVKYYRDKGVGVI